MKHVNHYLTFQSQIISQFNLESEEKYKFRIITFLYQNKTLIFPDKI